MNTDRRNSVRLMHKGTVQFESSDAGRWAEILNLGIGGMFIRGPKEFRIGEELKFRFFLKELNTWIRGEGVICWRRTQQKGKPFPEGYGLYFRELDKSEGFLLRQYLSVSKALQVIDRVQNKHTRARGNEIDPKG